MWKSEIMRRLRRRSRLLEVLAFSLLKEEEWCNRSLTLFVESLSEKDPLDFDYEGASGIYSF